MKQVLSLPQPPSTTSYRQRGQNFLYPLEVEEAVQLPKAASTMTPLPHQTLQLRQAEMSHLMTSPHLQPLRLQMLGPHCIAHCLSPGHPWATSHQLRQWLLQTMYRSCPPSQVGQAVRHRQPSNASWKLMHLMQDFIQSQHSNSRPRHISKTKHLQMQVVQMLHLHMRNPRHCSLQNSTSYKVMMERLTCSPLLT